MMLFADAMATTTTDTDFASNIRKVEGEASGAELGPALQGN